MGLLRPDQVTLKWHDGRARIWVHGYTLEHAAQRFFSKYIERQGAWPYVYVLEDGVRRGYIMLRRLGELVAPDVGDLKIKTGAMFPSRGGTLIVSRRMKEAMDSWGL